MSEGQTKQRKGFLAVDVWRGSFSPLLEKAVHSLYKELVDLTPEKLAKVKFRDKVYFLRELENPAYIRGSKLGGLGNV